MSQVQRVAGVNGTFTYTLNVAPYGVPQLTIYSDAARTQVAVAQAPTVPTANPQAFTASYPASLSAGTYYLTFQTVITQGQPALVDATNTLLLVVVAGTVNPVLISLSDAKTHLKIPASDTSHDAAIQTFIDAATPVVEFYTGPVAGSAYAETYDGGLSYVTLRHRPIQVVSSVVEYRGIVAYTLQPQPSPAAGGAYNFVAELDTGRIIRRSAGVETPFASGRGSVVVAYTAGRPTVPPNIALAAKELVRHWYQQTQQGGRPSFPNAGVLEDVTASSVQGFAIPNRVHELLAPHARAPSVA